MAKATKKTKTSASGPRISFRTLKPVHWMLLAGMACVAFVAVYFAFLPFLAERHYREGYMLEARADYYFNNRQSQEAYYQYQFAVEEYKDAVALAPYEYQYHNQLSKVYERMADIVASPAQKMQYLKKAEALAQQMATGDHQNPWHQNRLSSVYSNMANVLPLEREAYLKKAKAYSIRASEIDRHNPLFQLTHAFLLHRLGDIEGAKQYYNRALDMDANLPEAHFNLAQILRQEGKPQEAMSHYMKIYEANPNFQNVRLVIGRFYFEQRQYETALRYFGEAVSANLNDIDAHKSLVGTLHQMRRWPQALRYYELLLGVMPDDATLREAYINALLQTGNSVKASEQIRILAEKFPNNPRYARFSHSRP
ncbi:MAG: tetratricopeptide repeat protein [Candidatus Margulisiibacteriota bacterium]